MAVYPMFTEALPTSVCNDLDRCNRQLIWGEEDGTSKFHLIAWEQMTLPRKLGGAGIRPTRLANQALLAKGGWKLVSNDQSIWARVLRDKYARSREGRAVLQKQKGSSMAWRSFTSAINVLKKGYVIKVTNGRKTNFWHDPWVSQVPLIDLATEEISESRQARMVADLWDPDSGWKLSEFQDSLPQHIINNIRSVWVDPLAAEDDHGI
ncbi:unnamed protein product [Linum trigynum]|uniref:Uncharacterized protein n=1 Tax=Linum trigynum TaxID=586398 RepID=A0AAV2EFG9_9ROSI